MELKDYQASALDDFSRWLDALATARSQTDAAVSALEEIGTIDMLDSVRNYPRTAWQRLKETGGVAATAGEYVSRTDDAGRPIPHICFKVPTGGGKTLLAAAALERLNRQTGLTLWITPTRAIYQQTKDTLKNREHAYRQMLERASGGRVKLIEKDDPLTAADVENYLCVMLLSLSAANWRKNRDFLRMFRNSGRYSSFYPDSDVALADAELLVKYPDLERITEDGPVKHSLFNVFKMLRPVVILDEAHKAYGKSKLAENEEFVRSVNRLDPSLVVELSATPNKGISNLLVDIAGVRLKDEEMIKLPVQVTSFTNTEWQYTLAQAHEELERLDREARSYQYGGGRYIRPIAVVRVERTGKDQRNEERVHAEDVREYLIQNLSVSQNAVAVKSSEKDELGRASLLDELSPVRWIITKAALMEGWDCPFAYLLVMLDNTQAQNAITQLVGRVMRQPYAKRTDSEALDQCYVYCWDINVGAAVTHVKNGLEREGLTGLSGSVWAAGESDLQPVTIQRRLRYRDQNIFLPLVLHKHGTGWIDLEYQRHILPGIDWDSIQGPNSNSTLLDAAQRRSATVDVGDTQPIYYKAQNLYVNKSVNISWFARRLSDITPNSWQAARIAHSFIDTLVNSGLSDDQIYDGRSHHAHVLREHVKRVVEKRAENVFKRKLFKGDIRFDLKAGQPNYRMTESYEIPSLAGDGLLARSDGQTVQLSLFEPIYTQQFDSELERKFACYLDEQKALKWWHRVAVGQGGGYYLRGWKQERIWPDFVGMAGESDGKPHVLIFETKGEHLSGNPDTDYKTRVLETLENAFNHGTMTLRDGPAKGTFRLVFNEVEFPEALADLRYTYPA